jgi:hypothetical protein
MANTTKPRSEKKKVMSISIKTRHYEDFVDNCTRLNLVASHKVEELIVEFNNSLL